MEGRSIYIKGRKLTQRAVKNWNRFSREAVDILSEGVQGQVGWDFEQHILVGDVPAHSMRTR